MTTTSEDDNELLASSDDDLTPLLRQSPLLQALRRDGTSKLSVQECLRSKKALPHVEVQHVLEHRQHFLLNPEQLLLHNALVLQTLVVAKKLAVDNHPRNSNNHHATIQHDGGGGGRIAGRCEQRSSLWFISYLSIPIHYLQLLVELNHDKSESMIVQVLRGLTGFVCSILESTPDSKESLGRVHRRLEDDDDRDSSSILTEDGACQYKAVHVASYIFESLVRFNHAYVRTRPSLLSPLWKSLCDMTGSPSSSKQSTCRSWLPSPLIHNATIALLDYLDEGVTCVLTLVETTTDPSVHDHDDQLLFQCKVLGFLLSRLGVFWSIRGPTKTKTATSSYLNACVGTLSRLRGLCLVVTKRHTQSQNSTTSHQHAVTKAYTQLANKVEKVFRSRLIHSDRKSHDDSVLDGVAIQMTLQVPLNEGANTNHENGESSVHSILQCLALGMIGLSLSLFDAIVHYFGDEYRLSQSDVEAVLKLIHHLVFQCLPYSWEFHRKAPMLVLARFLTQASALLLKCETDTPCIAVNADPGRARFHRWLLSWLTADGTSKSRHDPRYTRPRFHPLSREVSMSLWHLQVLGLHRWSSSQAQGRRGSTESFSAATPLLSLAVELAFHPGTETSLRSHLTCFLVRVLNDGNDCGNDELGTAQDTTVRNIARSLIRSRMKKLEDALTSGKKRKRSASLSSHKVPTPSDLRLIVWLSSYVSAAGPSSFLRSILRTLNGVPNATALDVAALQLARTSFAVEPTDLDRFSNFFGLNQMRCKLHFIVCGESILESVLSQANIPPSSQNSAFVESTRLLGEVLNNERHWQDAPVSYLLFAAIQNMSSIGSRIVSPASDDSQKVIVQLFQDLLSHDDWAVRSLSMCSMIAFASTVPGTHRCILKPCVPEQRRKIFSSRLQNTLLTSEEQRATAWSYCHERLTWSVVSRHTIACSSRLFPEARTSTMILPGSYYMTMPTQEGRHAVVVFPPGEASLVDIRYMLGVEDESESLPVFTVHKSVALDDGTCKLELKEK